MLGGKIDRADRKENTIRILDYKTGGDLNVFTSVESLFERNNDKRNKAAFQALLYALVYEKRNPDLFTSSTQTKLQPGLINRKDIFKSDFEYGLYLNKQRLEDVSNLLPEFEMHLNILLQEIFNPDHPRSNHSLKTCSYCSYKEYADAKESCDLFLVNLSVFVTSWRKCALLILPQRRKVPS